MKFDFVLGKGKFVWDDAELQIRQRLQSSDKKCLGYASHLNLGAHITYDMAVSNVHSAFFDR